MLLSLMCKFLSGEIYIFFNFFAYYFASFEGITGAKHRITYPRFLDILRKIRLVILIFGDRVSVQFGVVLASSSE